MSAGPRLLTNDKGNVAYPILAERDLHHCCCCSPPQRTLVTDVTIGLGAGYPQFTCPKTKISMRYSEGMESYIGGRIILPGDKHFNESALTRSRYS